jgi:hypothetical protein
VANDYPPHFGWLLIGARLKDCFGISEMLKAVILPSRKAWRLRLVPYAT